jgi:hypothetical protein
VETENGRQTQFPAGKKDRGSQVPRLAVFPFQVLISFLITDKLFVLTIPFEFSPCLVGDVGEQNWNR